MWLGVRGGVRECGRGEGERVQGLRFLKGHEFGIALLYLFSLACALEAQTFLDLVTY